jgi:uncharacterized protein (DUF427 family)
MKAVLGDDGGGSRPRRPDLHRRQLVLPAVERELGPLQESPTPYTCPWKGECQYYSVRSGDELLADRAWSYPTPYESGIARVGKDFSGYVAFWKEVRVED